MIPHICRVKHDPPNSYGDCLRATIASYLSIDDIEHVPHFMQTGDEIAGEIMMRSWLATKGYYLFKTAYRGSLEDLFEMMREANPGVIYMLFCQCSGDDHVILCQNDKVIHNTAMFREPISGPHSSGYWGVLLVTPINP